MRDIFFWLSGAIQLIANVPYIVAIFRGAVRPQRTTWLIWSVLTAIAFGSQMGSGATTSLVFAGLSALNCAAVYLISLRRGVGGWGRADRLSLAAAGAGLALWVATKEPFAATLITTCVDLAGYLLTLRKAWDAPHSENATAYLLSGASAALAIASERQIVFQAVFFTGYIVLTNSLTALILVARRRRLA
jgi:hypothetical protein